MPAWGWWAIVGVAVVAAIGFGVMLFLFVRGMEGL